MEKTYVPLKRMGWNEADVEILTPAKADRGASKAEENKNGALKNKKGTIPIFFATDNNYLPFLSKAFGYFISL